MFRQIKFREVSLFKKKLETEQKATILSGKDIDNSISEKVFIAWVYTYFLDHLFSIGLMCLNSSFFERYGSRHFIFPLLFRHRQPARAVAKNLFKWSHRLVLHAVLDVSLVNDYPRGECCECVTEWVLVSHVLDGWPGDQWHQKNKARVRASTLSVWV